MTDELARLQAENEDLYKTIASMERILDRRADQRDEARAQLRAARDAIGCQNNHRPLPGHGSMDTGSRSRWYSVGVADSIARFDAAVEGRVLP